VTIQIDSREKPKATELIKAHFDHMGVKWFISKLPCGDYQSLDNARFCIDRKQSLQELTGTICQQHERFRAELIRAQELGITLVFLVEHGNSIKSLSDVRHWVNPRKTVSPYALDGPELYKRLVTIEAKYKTRFCFCAKHETGAKIIELLKEAQVSNKD
jgi:ERCC4-type nuclease